MHLTDHPKMPSGLVWRQSAPKALLEASRRVGNPISPTLETYVAFDQAVIEARSIVSAVRA
jgi:hypothetical protein